MKTEADIRSAIMIAYQRAEEQLMEAQKHTGPIGFGCISEEEEEKDRRDNENRINAAMQRRAAEWQVASTLAWVIELDKDVLALKRLQARGEAQARIKKERP